MMATIPYAELISLVKINEEHVVRTVPLPSSSCRQGPILVYPHRKELVTLLEHIGTPVPVETEAEITTLVRHHLEMDL